MQSKELESLKERKIQKNERKIRKRNVFVANDCTTTKATTIKTNKPKKKKKQSNEKKISFTYFLKEIKQIKFLSK